MFFEKVDILDRNTRDLRVSMTDGNLMDWARRVNYTTYSTGRMELCNSLYELDTPGEYYIDRKKNWLLFYPPVSTKLGVAKLTMNPGSIVQFDGTKYLDFQGFSIEGGRVDGVQVNNGTSIVIRGCRIKNCNGDGVQITDGNAVTVRSCEISEMGEGGIRMEGGVRATMTRGNHLADNNYLHNLGVFQPFYRPGIWMKGFGLTARNNEIAYHPHDAIWFFGNEILIEFNRIHHVVQDACDAAAIYADHDWTTRGNIIRYNYLTDIKQIRPGYHIVHGIYLDDMFSSADIIGNVFRRVEQPIQLGGGHDCRAMNNVFVDCNAAVRVDDRGITGSTDWINDFFIAANNVPWSSAAWQERYPGAYNTLTSSTYRIPSGNVVSNNVALRGRETPKMAANFELWGVNASLDPAVITFTNNVVTDTQQFVDEPNGVFTPLSSSQAFFAGFATLSTSGLGVKKDSMIDPSTWPKVP